MNRKAHQAKRRKMDRRNERLPNRLTLLSREAWPETHYDQRRASVWVSRSVRGDSWNDI